MSQVPYRLRYATRLRHIERYVGVYANREAMITCKFLHSHDASHMSGECIFHYTVDLQWLEHCWLVSLRCSELVLQSLGKNPIAADLK